MQLVSNVKNRATTRVAPYEKSDYYRRGGSCTHPIQFLIGCMTILVFLCCSSGLAASGKLEFSPAISDDRGLVVQAKTTISASVTTDIASINHASLNITRGGRALGDFPLKQNGNVWSTNLKLEFPGSHILTVRLFEGTKIWSAATDLTGIESAVAKNTVASGDLEFLVTTGKAGGDTSPAFGLLALLGLIALVFLGTRVFGKTVKS
jgi:hypothetical protein